MLMNFSDPYYIIKDELENTYTINDSHIEYDDTLEKNVFYFDGRTCLKTSPIKLGGCDFTIDFWIKTNKVHSTSYWPNVFQMTTSSTYSFSEAIHVAKSKANTIVFSAYPSSATSGNNAYSSEALTINNTYYHIAIVYINKTPVINFYLDGVCKVSFNHKYDEKDRYIILGYSNYIPENSNRFYIGYLSDLRVTSGIARWTEDFDVSTIN